MYQTSNFLFFPGVRVGDHEGEKRWCFPTYYRFVHIIHCTRVICRFLPHNRKHLRARTLFVFAQIWRCAHRQQRPAVSVRQRLHRTLLGQAARRGKFIRSIAVGFRYVFFREYRGAKAGFVVRDVFGIFLQELSCTVPYTTLEMYLFGVRLTAYILRHMW